MLATLCLGLAVGPQAIAAERASADVLIRGGTIHSGNAPPFVGDVVVTGDTIAYVGPDAGRQLDARSVIDAKGKIVAPGFIDAHTHPDTYIRSDDPRQRRTHRGSCRE